MPALPRPGDRLAGFRIERELGRGTTGVVFLAFQEALGRRVALKVVGRPLADDEAFRARFRREARTVAGLDHPNVVQVLESGEDDEHLWLAMRYVDGPDLRVLLRRTGRLDPVQAVAVVEGVAAALDAAHAAGLVHRDVKPANVLVEDGPGRDLHVELADFGLAREPGPRDPEGTPGYAAPEQLAGGAATPASDVYALGCVLFELLTGFPPPVPPATPGPAAVAPTGPLAGQPTAGLRPSEALPRLGGAFDPAVERATDPDPARRFASAGELALWARAALTVPRDEAGPSAGEVRAAAGAPAAAWEVGTAGGIAAPWNAGPAAPTWESPPRRRRRRRWLVVPLLVLLLAALAVAFAFIGRLGSGERTGSAGPPAASTATAPAQAGTPIRTTPTPPTTPTTPTTPTSPTTPTPPARARGGTSGAAATGTTGSAAGTSGHGAGAAGTAGSTGGTTGSATGTQTDAAGAGTRRSSRTATAGAAEGSAARTVPRAASGAPGAGAAAALPPVAPGDVRFGGGFWSLDLPATEGWRQTSTRERDGGARVVTRLRRADGVGLVVEQLPGRTAVFGPAPGAPFPVRLPGAGRTTAVLFTGGRYRMCVEGACGAVAANGPSGGVLLVAGAQRADGARRLTARAASGLRVR